jgi:hypothetical protein
VKDSTTKYVEKEDGDGYGYLWTVYPAGDHYAALGLGGQQIHIYPPQNLIVVTTASLDSYAGTPEIDDLLKEYILPSIKADAAIVENPDGNARLNSLLETATYPVQPIPMLPGAALENSNHPYSFEDNPFGWETLEFVFTPETSTALVIMNKVPLTVGLDNIFRLSKSPEGYDMLLRGRWTDDQTFIVDYPYPMAGIMVLGETAESEVRFKFIGNQVEVTAEQLTFEMDSIHVTGTR